MKHDIKEMSYVFTKEKRDKDLIYKIDILLYNKIDDYFIIGTTKNVNLDLINYKVLEDRDTIITFIVDMLLKSEYEDANKLWYLVNEEFTKVVNKVKKYYIEQEKVKNKLIKTKEQTKDEELKELLNEHFDYCFNVAKEKRAIKDILTLMCTNDFRQGTLEDLEITRQEYKNFDKIYDSVLNEFKRHHKYDLDECYDNDEHLSLGWGLYGIIKAIEGLFKI